MGPGSGERAHGDPIVTRRGAAVIALHGTLVCPTNLLTLRPRGGACSSVVRPEAYLHLESANRLDAFQQDLVTSRAVAVARQMLGHDTRPRHLLKLRHQRTDRVRRS